MIPDNYIEDLKSRLASQAEDVCRHLLTGGNRKGKRWICGGVDGGPGQSMNVELEGSKAGLFRDAATGEAGTLLDLWMMNQGLKFTEAVAAAASHIGMPPPDTRETAPKLTVSPSAYTFEEPEPEEKIKPVGEMPEWNPSAKRPISSDWEKAVKAFSDDHAATLCEWRGFSRPFVDWLHKQELIGVHNGGFAFPVHDDKGVVTRIHYRMEKAWAYHPKGGGENSPLVIGNPIHAVHTLAFESQWDALAILDRLDAQNPENEGIYSAFITRGATSNTNLSKLAIPHLIAFPQNDPPEKKSKTTGRTPAEEWLFKLQSTRHQLTDFAVFDTPEQHKDANDWIREDNPDQFFIFKHAIEGAKNPILKNIRTVRDLLEYDLDDDPNALIGFENRFLSKGGSWVWIAPSGVGKSTLLSDFCIHATAGLPWHGIQFRKPMRTLVVQAENDEGDMAEMMKGALANKINRAAFTDDDRKLVVKNYLSHQETERTAQKFCQWLEEIIRETKVDLVCVDPLLSYVGDDISLQKVASQFLRNWLQPVLKRTGVILIVLHHTGKPVKDGTKSTKGWSESDFSYMGLGSSELVNWARAVSVIVPTKEDGTFLMKISKRGKRAGMIDLNGMHSKEIFLRHGTAKEGLAWFQTRYEEPEEEERQQRGDPKPPPEPMDYLHLITGSMRFTAACELVRKKGKVSLFNSKNIVNNLLFAGKLKRDSSEFISRT